MRPLYRPLYLAGLLTSLLCACSVDRDTAPVERGPAGIDPGAETGTNVEQRVARGRFESILWLHGGPARDEAFFETVKQLGFSAVSVSGGEKPGIPGRYGLRYYHDQICSKGVLELRPNQFDPLQKAYQKDRDSKHLVRPGCLSSFQTLAGLSGLLSDRLRLTLPNRPLAISLGDEISTTRHNNPLDFCFSPHTLRAFRAFLRHRYKDLETLNKAWLTNFQGFGEVKPFTADQIRARELDGPVLPKNLTPWAEHLEFMDAELAGVVQRLAEQVRRHDKDVPVGLTGLPMPSAYGGHDYTRLMPLLSFYEVYDQGGARALAMSMAPDGSRQVQTLFPPKGNEPADFVRARIWDQLAHGLWGMVVWSAGDVVAMDGQPTDFGRAVAAALKELKPALAVFGGAKMRHSPIWLVESQASTRAHWMLDSKDDGDTWIRRLSSYEATHSTSAAARHGWVRIFQDLGMQPLLVPVQRLAEALPKSPPKLLVLPATLALSDEAGKAITAYTKKGGVVVADHGTGIYDERLQRRDPALLDSLFGITRRSLLYRDQLVVEGVPRSGARLKTGAAAAEAVLRGSMGELQDEFQVQIENNFGRGRAIYLNMAVCEYGRVRLDQKKLRTALDLRQRVDWVLRQAGIDPPVLVSSERVPTCLERVVLKAADGRMLLAIRINALESPAVMTELAKSGPRPVTVTFPQRKMITDLRSGISYDAATQHKLRMDPMTGLLLVVEPPR